MVPKREKKEMMTVDVEQEKGLFNQASYRHFCECALCFFFSLHCVVVHQIVTVTNVERCLFFLSAIDNHNNNP